MDTLTINIINPKAMKLLKDLADMDLISIHNKPQSRFKDLVERLQTNSANAPSLEEITAEVEAVRAERYAK
jgi:hypothetical protein